MCGQEGLCQRCQVHITFRLVLRSSFSHTTDIRIWLRDLLFWCHIHTGDMIPELGVTCLLATVLFSIADRHAFKSWSSILLIHILATVCLLFWICFGPVPVKRVLSRHWTGSQLGKRGKGKVVVYLPGCYNGPQTGNIHRINPQDRHGYCHWGYTAQPDCVMAKCSSALYMPIGP